ncbi:Hypothetical protein precursor [Devosia sp. LC5]|uniref:TIGR02186 family protein n=1 Tax=Devosia sp. LC5 TaxID=1502724 RepID=UPI0004E3EF6D|nr:TIGR02186 family protein [Devosia sp. LC5]KFC71199.1 Hypothetical protein precursor [Devosia sp. LC5]
MRRLLAIVAIIVLSFAPAAAQDEVNVVFVNSDPVVAVHSNFRGQTVTLFGSIEPGQGAPEGPYSVVVLVQGPSSDWVVREKGRQGGLVLNKAAARYAQAPSYYAVLSSSPLSQIAPPEVVDRQRLSFAGLAALTRQGDDLASLDPEFVRLMRSAGNFIEAERGVVMHSPTTFSARVPIDSNAVNGLYLARALIIADGKVIGETTTRFTVRTQDFERYVANLATSNPPLYGLATILLALGTGWLGGMLFKR